jgi:hypothetical protein
MPRGPWICGEPAYEPAALTLDIYVEMTKKFEYKVKYLYVEAVKKALEELAEKEPEALRRAVLRALSAEDLAKLIASSEGARRTLAEAIAGAIAIPLNVATREDIRRLEEKMATKEELKRLEERMATKEDLKRLEDEVRDIKNRMATKEQFEDLALSIEEFGRGWISYLLEQKGYKCTAERRQIGAYELDIYCNAGAITVVGEAKVRAGPKAVERVVERAEALRRGWPQLISGRLVPVVYTYAASPQAVEAAKRLGVWLIEGRRELVALEEALKTQR